MTRPAFHAQRLAYCLPWTLYSLVVHTCKLKGPKRSLMAARTPWHHARSMVSRLLLESHLKVSSVSLIVVQCLIYWFLCGHFWNLGRGNKAESILKVRWLRSSMLDHSCWLYLWFTGSASSRWLNCCSQRAILGFEMGVWVDEPHLWLEDFFCGSVMFSGRWRSANSSSLRSCFPSVWISHALGNSSVPLCLLSIGASLSINTST